MTRFLGAVAAAGLAVGVAAADPYTVKLKSPAAADRVKVEKEEISTRRMTVVAMGNERKDETQSGRKMAYTDEVLKRAADGTPDQVRRVYAASEIQTDGVKRVPFPAAKPILATRTNGVFGFAFENGKAPIPAEDAAVLERDFNKNTDAATKQALAPAAPVAVGGNWNVDVAKLTKALGSDDMEIDAAKSSATGTLTKVYTKGGKQWGQLDYKIDLAVTKLKAAKNELPMKTGSKMTLLFTVDACIDGTDSGYESKATMKAELEADDPRGTITLTMESKGGGTGVEVKK